MKLSFTTPAKLTLLAVAMFGFGFAMIPLYGLLCEVTGLGGRTGGLATYDPDQVHADTSRMVTVTFVTDTNDGMPWMFRARVNGMQVHPGELSEARFIVRNPTNRTMVAQAVPSLVPGIAAEFFHKTECFCFARQVLAPGEEREMPMRFFIAPEMPRSVESVSLSYTLFDVTQLASDGLIQSDA
jgi:cytochrome c oxidase assembly protein subunit 11